MYDRARTGTAVVYADAYRAAQLALNGRAIGRRLPTPAAGDRGPLAHDYPTDRSIDRRRGNYRYRTVVVGEGNGRRFETIVDVYSRARLTAAQVADRASDAFLSNDFPRHDYETRVGELGSAVRTQVIVLFAGHHPASRP